MKNNPATEPVISRRHFLGRTATFALASGVGAAAQTTFGKGKKKVLVGAHPWVYAAKQPGFDIAPLLPTIFADMEYAGLDGIELMGTVLRSKDAVDQIAELSKKHHLPVIGTSFSGNMWERGQHQAIIDDAGLIVPRLAKLGGRTLGASVNAAPKRKTDEQLDAQAELLRKLIALCDRHKVVLNLHNHTYEVTDNLHDLRGTLARIPNAPLGPDLGWLARAGVDPVWFIREFGKQIVFLHIRDQKDNRWSEAVGEGSMDYAAIGKVLHEVRFKGDAVIELAHERDFQPTRPIRESLKMSRAFVKEKLGY